MKRKLIIGGIIAAILLIVGFTIAGGAAADKRIAKHMELGNKYLEEGDYEQAILAFEAIIEIDENNIEARTAMAQAYIGLGDMEEAEEIIEEAIDIDGSNAQSCAVLTQIYEQTKTKPELAELYQKSFENTDDGQFSDWIENHTPQKPKVNLESGEYDGPQQIEITNLKEGETIYYILDGTKPDESKEKYDGYIDISDEEVTLKLLVINEWELTNTVKYEYKINQTKAGNTLGNAVNGNLAVEYGESVYYINTNSDIYKMDNNSASQTKIIELAESCDEIGVYDYCWCSGINVYKDWIYYVISINGYNNYLYKCKLDGSDITQLDVFPIEDEFLGGIDIIIVDDWLYIRNPKVGNGDLVKMRIDGNEKKVYESVIEGSERGGINVSGEWVYYNSQSDLYKIKNDASQKNCLTDNDGSILYFQVGADWIYYYITNYYGESKVEPGLYKMRTDGSDKTFIASDVFEFNIEGDWIYYINKQNISKMKIDGSDVMVLTNYEDNIHVQNLNIAGNWVIYKRADTGEPKVCLVKKDGSEVIENTEKQSTNAIADTEDTNTDNPEQIAMDKVFDIGRSKYDFKFGVMSLGLEEVEGHTYYSFQMFEDQPTHIVTLGFYRVDSETYDIYEEDYLTGDYILIE